MLWRDRAERLTNASLEDEWSIGSMREVLHARLAEAWWKSDPPRAQAWLKDAVTNVTREQKNETEDQRKQRIKAIEAVYRVCERLKVAQYAKQLLDSLMQIAMQQGPYPGTQHYSGEIASAIREAVMQVVRDDPARAAELGNQLIQLHSGDTILQTLAMLRFADEQAATQLYTNALTTAATTADYSMAFTLMQYAFPIYAQPVQEVSPVIKSFTLDTLGALLSQPLNSPDQHQEFCRDAPILTKPLITYFPPAQQGIIQASLDTCKAEAPEEEQHDDFGACNTADSCLKLADTVPTAERRARLKMEAAVRAREEKDSVRSLAILDTLTEDEREWIPEWVNDYENFGREAMEQLYKLHDTQAIQRLIDRFPDSLRAQMILNLAGVREVRDDKPYATLLLTEARRVLEKFPTDSPFTYLELMNLHSELLPNEAPQTFAFVTTALDKITYIDFNKEDKKNKKAGKDRPLFGYPKPGRLLEPVMINPILIDQDEPYITAAINLLSDPETRIAFRLTFLRYSLKRYDQARKEREQLRAPEKARAHK